MKISDIDSGNKQIKDNPLAGRKSISILLGAGFSAQKGYPLGKDMNKKLLNFGDEGVSFLPSSGLCYSASERKADQIDGLYNAYQKYFVFCKRLIKEYVETHNDEFDYELFYDFIKSNEVKEKRYQDLCDGMRNDNESFENFLFNVSHVYNQMVEYLLKDGDGKNNYDDEPFKIDDIDSYKGFLNYLSQLSREYIINVHTLNHDLLFESFNNTGYVNNCISDGFDEYGSNYYGNIILDNRIYHCRLERYTNRYNTPIRLFKLHGSLDYVPFYKKAKNGFLIPDKYVKIKYGMGAGDIMKGRKSKIGYDISPFENHPDFLTGTTSKIQRYNEPLLFKKLFKRFKKNLRQADKLIVIGYGCKDEGVNEIIKNCFDYHSKPLFILNKKLDDKVLELGKSMNAVFYEMGIDLIKPDLFS